VSSTGRDPLPVRRDRPPPELLVADEPAECPYLDGQTARMPLRLPARPLRAEEWEARLAEGDRRYGALLYRTECPSCRACEPIRVDVARFRPGRTQRRVVRRGRERIEVTIGGAEVDRSRVALYERHLAGRGLVRPDHEPMTPRLYRQFLVESCVTSFEIRYAVEGRLVGVALTDRAQRSLSAHYTYFDPDLAHLGLGTFSILEQLDLCRRWGLDWLYLGLYVAGSPHMRYKGRFRPHERLIDGCWTRFEKDEPVPPE
jgi:arginine-tRNA-protein transferase